MRTPAELGPLSEDTLCEGMRSFEADGFTVLEEVLGSEARAALLATAQRLAAQHDFTGDRAVFRTDDRDAGRDEAFFASARGVRGFLEAGALDEEGDLQVAPERALNKIGHALHDQVPEIRTLAASPLVRDAFRVAGLEDAQLVQSMLIFKQPGIGGAAMPRAQARAPRAAARRRTAIVGTCVRAGLDAMLMCDHAVAAAPPWRPAAERASRCGWVCAGCRG